MNRKFEKLSQKSLMNFFLSVLLALYSYMNAAQAGQLPELNVSISESHYTWIGERIFQNEGAGKSDNLLFWSENEPFPSLGIGHFIWFPRDLKPPFDQTFPQLIQFIQANYPQYAIPQQLTRLHPPWISRKQFIEQKKRGELVNLQLWFIESIPLQAEYIVQRFYQKLPEVVSGFEARQEASLNTFLQKLLLSKNGVFALIDYGNFKGFGTHSKERYQGQGWGLKQVFERVLIGLDKRELNVNELSSQQAVHLFVRAAKRTLQNRVELSPSESNESRWLSGWFKRLESYK